MNVKQKAFLSMAEVAKIRSERARAALTRILHATLARTDTSAALQRRLDALVTERFARIREATGGVGRVGGMSDEVRMRIDWVDRQITETDEKLGKLKRELDELSRKCQEQRRAMLKHDELNKVFRGRSVELGRRRAHAAEEEEADGMGSVVGRRVKP
ncbi:hypothetical protein WT27_14760 [Burkholderia territorii]|uniref:Uncharacterized protein n=1 Tax=Burkholderia territorii TaxID=1503055 RepID=A0A119DFA3_9BURK|nr:hypothetical protein [Burkholderia territorii]KVV39184.1 hypothetical protein WT27_14760 [Burkholderia territorii]KVX26245.1 hypothetical protein WT31_16685 [Burkholderia territorii]